MEETREPYVPGSHDDCCCGKPTCTDFEDRMAAWGIPLDELTVVTTIIPLEEEK
jgi:hypothetical protein